MIDKKKPAQPAKSAQSKKSAQSNESASDAGAQKLQNGAARPAAGVDRDKPTRRVIRINGRYFLLVVMVFGLIGGGTYLLHGYQVEKNAENLLALADEAEAEGKSEEALQYLSQYLRFRPDDYRRKLHLADLYESVSRARSSKSMVLGILEEVLRNAPLEAGDSQFGEPFNATELTALRRRVAELCVDLRRFRVAMTHIDKLRETAPDDVELTYLTAQCYTGVADYRRAVFAYLKAIQDADAAKGTANPPEDTVRYYVSLAELMRVKPESILEREDLESGDETFEDWILELFPLNRRKAPREPAPQVTAQKAPARARKPGELSVAAKTEDTANQRTIARVYNLLVERGTPMHAALIARADFNMGRQRFELAQADVASARALRNADARPEILTAETRLHLAWAGQLALDYQYNANRFDGIRRHLDAAEAAAKKGLQLEPPDNLRFFTQTARIEKQRSSTQQEFEKRREHLLRGKESLTAGLSELEDYRKAAKPADLDPGRLVALEIDLRQTFVDLLFALARRENGDVDANVLMEAGPDGPSPYAEQMQRLVRLGASPVHLALYEAQALLTQRKWTEAAAQLSAARRQFEQSQTIRRSIDRALSECYHELQNSTQEQQTLRAALTSDPFWHEGRLMYARALESDGKLDDALREYRFLAGQGVSNAFLEVVRLELKRQSQKPAKERRLQSYMADLERAKDVRELNQATVALLKSDAVLLKPAESDLERENLIGQALTIVYAAIEKHPDDVPLQIARERLELIGVPAENRTVEIEAAIGRLKRRLERADRSETPVLLNAVVQFALNLPKEAAGEKLEELKDAADQLPSRESASFLQTIARGYARLGDLDKCQSTLELVAKDQPTHLGTRLMLAELARRRGDQKLLQKQLEAIHEVEGPNEALGNYYAGLGLMRSVYDGIERFRSANRKPTKEQNEEILDELKRAKRLFETVQRLRPEWAAPYVQAGRAAEAMRNGPEMYENYQRAIDRGDRSLHVITMAAEYLRNRGETADAERLVRLVSPSTVKRQTTNFQDQRATLSEVAFKLALGRGDYDEAQRLLPEESEDYSTHLLAAAAAYAEYRGLDDKGRAKLGPELLGKAENRIEKAILETRKSKKSNEEIVRPWLYWVLQLKSIDDSDKAESVTARALQELPDGLKHRTAARSYVILGDAEKAESHFELAVKQAPQDAGLRLMFARFHLSRGGFLQAKQQLQPILDGKTTANEEERKVARHSRVIAVAGRGRPPELEAALKLLPELKKATREELGTYVAVLSKGGRKQDRVALIAVLEELDSRKPGLSDKDRFQLARLYEKNDRWPDARRIVESLTKDYEASQLLLGWYAVELLKHERDDEESMQKVHAMVRQLRRSAPGKLSTATVHAELLLAEDKPDEAAGVIRDTVAQIVGAVNVPTRAELVQVAVAASLAERKGLHETAEQLFKDYARFANKPEAKLELAKYYGRQGRRAEALRICTELKNSTKPTTVAVTAASIVTTGRASDGELRIAKQLMDAAMKALPEAKQAVLEPTYADFLAVVGDDEAAEATYRKLLMKNPQNVAVLNNLAYLLAMQKSRLSEALSFSEQSIAVAGPAATLLDTKALVLIAMEQPQKAIELLQRAVDEQPAASYYLHLAKAHLAQGDRTAAVEAMEKARAAGLSRNQLHRLEQGDLDAVSAATGMQF